MVKNDESAKSSSELSTEQVAAVARLAMLDLTDAEVDKYKPQLEAILGLADQLESFELDDLVPTAHPHGLTNVYRDDLVENSEITEAALAVAPDVEDNQFKVPPALGESS